MRIVIRTRTGKLYANAPQLCDGTCSNDRARTSAKVMLQAVNLAGCKKKTSDISIRGFDEPRKNGRLFFDVAYKYKQINNMEAKKLTRTQYRKKIMELLIKKYKWKRVDFKWNFDKDYWETYRKDGYEPIDAILEDASYWQD